MKRNKIDRFLTYFLISFVYLFLSLRFFKFIINNSSNLLFWDQWDFYHPIFEKQSLVDLFLWQHGPHRMGLGLIITKFIDAISSWDSSVMSLTIGLIIFLSSILALWLKKRLIGKVEIFDIVIPFIFLNLYQGEVLVGTPNSSLASLPLLFVILTSLFFTYDNLKPIKWDILLLLINALAVYTGFGIFLSPLIIFYFILKLILKKERKVINALFSAITIITLLTFFINYKSAGGCLESPKQFFLFSYIQYIFFMINSFFGYYSYKVFFFIAPTAFLLSYIYLIYSFWKTKNFSKYFSTITLFSFSLLFAISSSAGRICLGITQGQSSRYVTFLIPMYLGLYIFLCLIKSNKIYRHLFLSAIIVLFIFISNKNISLEYQKKMTVLKKSWKECYLQYEDIGKCNQLTGFQVYPNPEATKLEWKLNYLKKNKLNLFSK